MSEDLSLGIDLGTTSVKVCLLRIKDGTVISSFIEPTESTIVSDVGPIGSEQDPAAILQALQKCMVQVPTEQRRSVKCIAVAGQMHGIMLWKDSTDIPNYVEPAAAHGGESTGEADPVKQSSTMGSGFTVRNTSQLFTWQDQRCTPEFLSSLPHPQSHFPVSTGHGCATLFWLTKNKSNFISSAGYTCAGTVMDYLVWVLCGGRGKPLMTVQNANSWGYYDNKRRTWNLKILQEAGFPIGLLPDVVEPGHVAGKLQFDWLGIGSDIPILAAIGDLQCYVYSALQMPTDAVLNLSTSSQVVFAAQNSDIQDTPDSSKPVQYFPYFDGGYIAVAASLNGGNVLSQFVDMLVRWTSEFGTAINKDHIWTKLLDMATEKPDKNIDGLNIIPTIYGERHAPLQTASVTGLTCDNLDLGSIFRSMCKGLVGNLCNMMPPSYLKQNGITRLIGTGSVISRNSIVKQEVLMQYGKDLEIMFGESCDSAVGVALYASRHYR